MVLEDAIRVLAEAPVIGPARRLDVGDVPRLRPEHAQQRLGMRRAGANLEVERLLNDASLRRPEGGQFEDEILEGHDRVISFSTLIDRGSRSRCIAITLRCSASSSRSAARSAATPARSCGLILRAAARNACASGDRFCTPRRRIHALQAQQPDTRSIAPAARAARRSPAPRPSTRRGDTAARLRGSRPPTRR